MVNLFFRWLPGRTAALFVKIHRPDICLPASGLTLVQDNGIRLLNVNGVNLPIRSYRFDDSGAPLPRFLLFIGMLVQVMGKSRQRRTKTGRRGAAFARPCGATRGGCAKLELVVWGYQDDREAASALRGSSSKLWVLGSLRKGWLSRGKEQWEGAGGPCRQLWRAS